MNKMNGPNVTKREICYFCKRDELPFYVLKIKLQNALYMRYLNLSCHV